MPTDTKEIRCSGFAEYWRDEADRNRKEAEEAWARAGETRSQADVTRACLAEGAAELCDLEAAVEEADHQEWHARMRVALERHGLRREARSLRQLAVNARRLGAHAVAAMAESAAEYIDQQLPPRKIGLSSGATGPDMRGKPWL